MNKRTAFLSDLQKRPWSPVQGSSLQPAGLFLGKGPLAMEITVAHATRKPSDGEIRRVWKARKGSRGAPLVLIILYSDVACLCGATGDEPDIYPDLDGGQTERLCRELLDQSDRHAALRLLKQTELGQSLPGLRNEGLLALHELEHGVPNRNDLDHARKQAQTALGLRGNDLLKALGFSIEPLDSLTSVLRSPDKRTALAVMLHENESVEHKEPRFNQLSPVSYAFRKADSEDLPWILFTQGNRIRLYATSVTVGVGRRGRTETYIECQPWLLSDDQLHYLWLIYSADALTPGGSLDELLEGSTRFAGDLAKRLRERIYKFVVPALAQGITQARDIAEPTVDDLTLAYEMALTVLFRLLFIAYAEDRNLLPYGQNDAYHRRSLKEKAKELADAVEENTVIAEGTIHWRETVHLWKAIAKGNTEWEVPAYGGALFVEDEKISLAGAELSKIEVSNDYFEYALRNLLVIQTSEGVHGPVDFRSLGVREFGTIYEGLLESELARADMDLVLKRTKNGEVYIPAKERDEPEVAKGEVYIHNRSGARKATGSYYTKSFVVDHLLDRALAPALQDHFTRLNAMDDVEASESFFDFRVADIAMGSGHFLISAIDLMEQRMADYLADRRLPIVMNELNDLRSIAMKQLGETRRKVDIEDSQLLRRLIARRCIYGVDINSLAVQLTRLAVWIHTFVPGLPLSFLDRTLIHGNSLVGIGGISEMEDAFKKFSVPVFNRDSDVRGLLAPATKPLHRLANSNDTSLEEIEEVRTAQEEVRTAIRGTEILFDLLTAVAIDDEPVITAVLDEWEELSCHIKSPKVQRALRIAEKTLKPLSKVHFPVVFPEVFLRERDGFDVILGNPPWEKVKVEQHAFWARHFPGLRGNPQREQEAEKERLRTQRPDLVALYERELDETSQLRKALIRDAYPGIGTGDPDLYKAFCWRFWRLSSAGGGYIGVVLPRSILIVKGSERFRKTMLAEAANVGVVTLKNRAGWVFDEVTGGYTVALLCAQHGKPEGKPISLQGPYNSLAEFIAGNTQEAVHFMLEEVKSWNNTVSLPLLPRMDSVQVFVQLNKFPRLGMSYMYNMGGGGEGMESASRCRIAPYQSEVSYGPEE